jgi:hypothetical protein
VAPSQLARHEALEPFLFGGERQPWQATAKTAAALAETPQAGLSFFLQHSERLVSVEGVAPEIEVGRCVAFTQSPAVMVRDSIDAQVFLGQAEIEREWPVFARITGLASLLIVPVPIGETVVGALWVGSTSPLPASSLGPTLQKMAQQTGRAIDQTGKRWRRDTYANSTMIDPGASLIALRGSMRQMQTEIERAFDVSAALRTAVQALDEGVVIATLGEATQSLASAVIAHNHARKRLDSLEVRGLDEELREAKNLLLTILMELAELQPVVELGRALANGSLSDREVRRAFALLPDLASKNVARGSVIALTAWTELVPGLLQARE